ncbi:MAG: Trk system potassium transporter TrkA [Ruminococcaceae bacterium]|nr:Trk system potassium transporter TrkA [Oscillospiraceae bacterium]
MKIIVVGVGKLGNALVKQLTQEGHDVIIIDTNSSIIDNVVNVYDVMGVCGNGASYLVQREAQVAEAELLIATTSSDEINIFACLVAKKIGVDHTIARVRTPEYEQQLRFMRNDLGLTMALNPERETAHEIARVLRFPNAVKMESFSKGRLELVEYRIPSGSALDGLRLMDLYRSLHIKILICAVARGNQTVIPGGDFILQAGDSIHLTASAHELEQFFRQLGVFKDTATSAMIIGASKIGYYLAQELIQMGIAVRIIDQDEQRCTYMSEQLPKALMIVGDGTDPELLDEEGIEDTDAFVAVTGLDEANILMCLSASRMTNCKTVAKVNRRSMQDVVLSTSMLDSIVSTSHVSTDLILQYVRGMQNASGMAVKTLHRLLDGKIDALEFTVPADLPCIGTPLKDLKLKPGILLAGIVRQNGQIIIPSGDDCLRLNDDVVIVTTNTNIRDLREILM